LVSCFKLATFNIQYSIFNILKFRGGQQAALARDSNTTFRNSGTIANLTGRRNRLNQRRFQGIGIGSNGLIIPRRNSNDDDDEEEEDVEEGRQRMGFDRLRAVSIFIKNIGLFCYHFLLLIKHISIFPYYYFKSCIKHRMVCQEVKL
jgi:hypothetical protein